MKGLIRVVGQVLLAIWFVNRLPVETVWERAGFLMTVLVVPMACAIVKKRANDLLTLALVYSIVGGVGGICAPDNWHLVIWGLGIIATGVSFSVGMMIKFGLVADLPKQSNHIHELVNVDGIVYPRH